MPTPDETLEVQFKSQRVVDLQFTDGKLDVVEGKDEWIQANKLGLISQEGDWKFDPAEGLPWVNHPALPPGRLPILGSTPPIDEDLIEVYIYQQLTKDSRNEVVRNIEATWDDISSRTILARAEIKGTDGLVAEITDEVSQG